MPLPPNQSPLIRKADEIATKVADDYLRNGVDPSEAIAKFGADLFSTPFKSLVISRVNHEIFKVAFATRGKRSEFPVASLEKVEHAMKVQKAASTVSPVWGRDLETSAHLAKLGTHIDASGHEVNAWGAPAHVEEPKYNWSEYNRDKVANEYYDVLQTIELEKDMDVEVKIAFADASAEAERFLGKAARAGEPLFDVAFNVAAHCEPEKRASAALFIDAAVCGLIASGQISKQVMTEYQENLKTASLDFLDNGYPVLRGGDTLVMRLNTLIGLTTKCDRLTNLRKIKYRVDELAVPRESRSYVMRDATVDGVNPIF